MMRHQKRACGRARTDFLGLVVGETEGRGANTFTYVCERCKLFFLVVGGCPPTVEKYVKTKYKWLLVWSVRRGNRTGC